MAIQYPSISPDAYLRANEKATPNYADLINKGLQTFIGLNQAKYQLPQEEVKAKYAEPMANLGLQLKKGELGLKQGELGLLPYRQQLLQAQINKANRVPTTPMEDYINGINNIKNKYGEDSKEYNIATQLAQSGNIKGIPKTSSGLTNAIKTQNQNIILNVPKVNKLIDDIINAPSPLEIPGYRPGAKAQHHSLVKEAAEGYAKAKGWPNTNESIKSAEVILGRGTLETDEQYRARLKHLQKTLNENYDEAQNVMPGVGKPRQVSHDNDPLGIR